MVVCRYFLQGTCKFGNNCYNEHQDPNRYKSYGENHQSILRQTNFNAAKPASSIDVNALVKAVVADMCSAEKGGQWILSSYAPFKEKPEFPGFEDTSPEEVRLGYYEAQKNGTMDYYKKQLQMHLQNALMKVKALQNPDQEIINILQRIYNTTPSKSEIFGPDPNSSLNNQSGFSKNNMSNQSSNIFKTFEPEKPNIFANPTQPQAQSNIFGTPVGTFQQNPGHIFNNTPNTNIFATPNPEHTTGNIFATGQKTNVFASETQKTPLFGSNDSGFIAQSKSMFEQQPTNIFGQNVQTTAPDQNRFEVRNQNFLDRNKTNSGGTSVLNYSSSIFGNSNPVQGTGLKQSIDYTLYSKIEDLKEHERQWFTNETSGLMDIPDKPPLYEMCFKL